MNNEKIQLDCQGKNINESSYFENQVDMKVTEDESGVMIYHNLITCCCNKNVVAQKDESNLTDQDEINREVGRKIIEEIEIARKEVSLQAHHSRLNSLENVINFIAGPEFIKYIKEQLKDNHAQD